MKPLLLLALLLPLAVGAQVHRCIGPDGKTIVLTDKPCAPSDARGKVNVPLVTELTPAERKQAMAESKERTNSYRQDAIQAMLENGKTAEARRYARTAEERAMVGAIEQAEATQRRQARQDVLDAEARESRERRLKARR